MISHPHQCADTALRLGLYRCPKCGCEVQMFSDEISVVCTDCGHHLVRARLKPCVEWCASATTCLTKIPLVKTVTVENRKHH